MPIKVPVANIGRGDYNDVVIADPSVSTMHAKLQRRDAVWILTDLGSTNGTFVEGERLTGEAPLGPAARSAAIPAEPSHPVAQMAEVSQPRPRPRRPIHVASPRPKSPSTIMVVGLLILIAILAYLLSTY